MRKSHALICFALLVLPGASLLGQESRDRFKEWDANNDARLSQDELPEQMRAQIAPFDVDNSGSVTRAEFDAYLKNRTRAGRRSAPTEVPSPSDPVTPGANDGIVTSPSPDGTHPYQDDPRVSQKYHDLLPDDLKDKVTVKAKVFYGDKELQYVNAFLLTSDQPTPVILTYHAGGWAKGMPTSSSLFREGSEFLRYLRAGICWVDVGYSLTGADYSKATPTRDPAHWPVQGQDAAMGVQLTRHLAEEWNIDTDRIAITGRSAGGHLAMWVAFSDDQADPESDDPLKRLSSRVTCVICMGAPVDFRWFDIPSLAASQDPTVAGKEDGLSQRDLATCVLGLIGCTAENFDKTEASKRTIDDANLLNKIDADDPPALLVFQKMDPGVPTYPEYLTDPHSYWNGVALQRTFAEVGVDLDYEGGADWVTKFNFLKEHLHLEGTAEPGARRRGAQR